MEMARWLGVRMVVGAGAAGTVLGLAQLTVYAMAAAFSNLTPYAGP